ncbi:MAG: tetratricopeptide repeat protein, partial [Hyphomicrobiales bacterium]
MSHLWHLPSGNIIGILITLHHALLSVFVFFGLAFASAQAQQTDAIDPDATPETATEAATESTESGSAAAKLPPPILDPAFGAYQRGYYLEAFGLALEKAMEGDAPSQTLVGQILYQGEGMAKNYRQAADWFRLAAKSGDPQAKFALGMMHLRGHGVLPDKAIAAQMFKEAGNTGHADALYNLALLYLEGEGV